MRLFFSSSSWVPVAWIFPSSRITILSACATEEILCAIMILVVPGRLFAIPSRILASVAVSTALVESSSMSTFGFFSKALAIQSLCFCPPETLTPPCPRSVSYPFSSLPINSSTQAIRQASSISSSVASSFPHRRLSLTVPEKVCFSAAPWQWRHAEASEDTPAPDSHRCGSDPPSHHRGAGSAAQA